MAIFEFINTSISDLSFIAHTPHNAHQNLVFSFIFHPFSHFSLFFNGVGKSFTPPPTPNHHHQSLGYSQEKASEMATCCGLQQLFERPLPENPSFHDSWKHIQSMKAAAGHNHNHNHHHHSFTEIFGQPYLKDRDPTTLRSPLFTLSPASSLSSDEDEMRNPARRSRRNYGGFPPPISCIGKRCLQPVRQNGRLILTEMRISTQEFLHACRENGRLQVHVVHSDEEEDDVETIHGGEDLQITTTP